MANALTTAFVADEPEFASLRPDLLHSIRIVEVELRNSMQEAIDHFPVDVRVTLEAFVVESPRSFIRSILPILREMSNVMDWREIGFNNRRQ
jgi:hypothetical protein